MGGSESRDTNAPDTSQTGYIYTYVERLGINPSFIRQHYELPIAMGASSRSKKSRYGITIRKNKQSVSTAEGSSSRLNRTESYQSNKVRTMSNMIPCFPTSNGTDAHHCDTISNRSSPSHYKGLSFLIFPKSEPGQLRKIYATAWKKITKDII
jgi:hypothetical protein